MSERLDEFVERLCELELDPQLLREDPSGERWLPASLRRMAAEDPECASELAEFVAMELALHQAHEPCDAFFTRAVMVRLPAVEAVDDRRRTWILASAYALGLPPAQLEAVLAQRLVRNPAMLSPQHHRPLIQRHLPRPYRRQRHCPKHPICHRRSCHCPSRLVSGQ